MNDEPPKFANEKIFKDFMTSLNEVVDLDQVATKLPHNIKIADYVISDSIVLELKTLKSNPENKVIEYSQSVIDRINNDDNFPIFYGEHDFRKIAGLIEDGERIINKIDNLYFRQIEGVMRKANKQIKSTVEYLKMGPDYYGVLVILNEQADFYRPEVLTGYICRELLKENSDRQPKYAYINQVAFIQSSYIIKDDTNTNFIPCHFINNSLTNGKKASVKSRTVLKTLWTKFARYIGIRYYHIENPSELPITEISPRTTNKP